MDPDLLKKSKYRALVINNIVDYVIIIKKENLKQNKETLYKSSTPPFLTSMTRHETIDKSFSTSPPRKEKRFDISFFFFCFCFFPWMLMDPVIVNRPRNPPKFKLILPTHTHMRVCVLFSEENSKFLDRRRQNSQTWFFWPRWTRCLIIFYSFLIKNGKFSLKFDDFPEKFENNK